MVEGGASADLGRDLEHDSRHWNHLGRKTSKFLGQLRGGMGLTVVDTVVEQLAISKCLGCFLLFKCFGGFSSTCDAVRKLI